MAGDARIRVLAHVLTRNDEDVILPCLESLLAQDHHPLSILVSDNGSRDGTVAAIRARFPGIEVIENMENLGYAAGHNRAVARGAFDWFLALNADVVLAPDFLARALERAGIDPGCGMLTGKLLRPGNPGDGGPVLDSAGLVVDRYRRNTERGSGEWDHGQYDRPDEVFGAFGAAALYSRQLVDDLAPDGKLFEEDFFAFREEVDLAWRARARGWTCLYAPNASATHEHRYRPETRSRRPIEERRLQRRNRYLLLVRNESFVGLARDLGPIVAYELAALSSAMLREPGILPAYGDALRLLPRALVSRRKIRQSRTIPDAEINQWFRRGTREF